MEPEEAVGKVIRGARKRQGLSQEALALDAGVERNYVSLIERGCNSASVRILFKLCAVLDLPPSALLAQAEKMMHSIQEKKSASR
jgi:transcriptional regulator with XRE-family HTH domain